MDVLRIKYDIYLYTNEGEKITLNNLVQSATLEEQKGQLAQKASLTLYNKVISGVRISSKLKLCNKIFVYADGKELFRGTIWEWNPEEENQSRIVSIIAYDNLIFLQKSRYHKYFSAGTSTRSIVDNCAADQGIVLDYRWAEISHAKKPYQNQYLSDIILDALEDVRKQVNSKYVVRSEQDVMVVDQPGTNTEIYLFDGSNTMTISTRITMDGLLTRVAVYGKRDDDGRSSVEATVVGDTRYGTLQAVIYRDENQSIQEAKSEAQTLLDEHKKPEETRTVKLPNVPFIRKGDRIKMNAGSMNGYYQVIGTLHNIDTKTMTLNLEPYEGTVELI